MGVLNVTPDSFSDGGAHLAPDDARARFAQISVDGAAICDVGAESTRPGAQPVAGDEQLRRLAPVLEVMRAGHAGPVSIDTANADVAAAAIDAGAVLVNDITAGGGDPRMLDLVAASNVGICLMHMRGTPRTMQHDPEYPDVVEDVRAFLAERVEACVAAGIPEKRVLVDPGIGFGKTLAHNLALLAGLRRISDLGQPVVIGVSRKRMFEALLGRPVDERLAGSLAGCLAAVQRGAAVVRVHDVRETVDALRVHAAIEEAG